MHFLVDEIEYIDINPVEYEVTFDPLTDEDGSRIDGRINPSLGTIIINPNISPANRVITLWHEVLHGIIEQSGLDHDESLIRTLSHGLVRVIRDNPLLINATIDQSEYPDESGEIDDIPF